MKIENNFEVPLPPERAWDMLMDIEQVVQCMPGAELVEMLPDNGYRGKVSVKLGPLAVTFLGTARFETMDRAGKRATIKASGNEVKGRGGAQALVGFRMMESGANLTRVGIDTDLTLNGAVAQYGRAAGVIADVSQQIIDKFAAALKARIEVDGLGRPALAMEVAAPAVDVAEAPPVCAPQPPATVPISGLSVLIGALWRSFKRLFAGK